MVAMYTVDIVNKLLKCMTCDSKNDLHYCCVNVVENGIYSER